MDLIRHSLSADVQIIITSTALTHCPVRTQAGIDLGLDEIGRSICTACLVVSKKVSPYPTAERRVPEVMPVLCSQPAGDASHKPGGRLPLLSALRGLLPIWLLGEQRHDGCEQFA